MYRCVYMTSHRYKHLASTSSLRFATHLHSHVLKRLSSLCNYVFELEYGAFGVSFLVVFTAPEVRGLDVWEYVPPAETAMA